MSLDDGLTTPLPTDSGEPSEETGEGSLHYPNVYVFVDQFLVHIYARHYEPAGAWRWCSQWWDHPEAVSRLDALWQAFEALRNEPGTGPATWWRDYADPTMTALTDPKGPFEQCRAGERHKSPLPLPSRGADVGLIWAADAEDGCPC